MRTLIICTALVILAVLSGCAQPPRQMTADDFKVLRTYGFDTTVPEPQATWNPETYQLLARSIGGFSILDEGAGLQQRFAHQANEAKHETANPVWISRLQFAFGPKDNVITTVDERVVPTSEGISVVTLLESVTGKNAPLPRKSLTKFGYRPRVWGRNLVATSENRIYVVNPFGEISEFGPGFMPEPQRMGVGITWQERPVMEVDHWTGSDTRRGNLWIRWRTGVTTTLANGVEARWTAEGGVLYTVMRAEPLPGQPWWSGGTDIYYIANAKANPVLVAVDARSGSPHPKERICAAVGRSGALILCGFDGNFRHQLKDKGDFPEWSHDGRRLVAEEPGVDGQSERRWLQVYVFKALNAEKTAK